MERFRNNGVNQGTHKLNPMSVMNGNKMIDQLIESLVVTLSDVQQGEPWELRICIAVCIIMRSSYEVEVTPAHANSARPSMRPAISRIDRVLLSTIELSQSTA